MCHALRVTEAGATPRIPVTHRASKGGVAPASSELAASFQLSLHGISLLFLLSSLQQRLKGEIVAPEVWY